MPAIPGSGATRRNCDAFARRGPTRRRIPMRHPKRTDSGPQPPRLELFLSFRGLRRRAALGGGAASGCALALAVLLLGCGRAPPAQGPRVVRAPDPSPSEAYCAWYGDARDGLLYFGQAPFWSALRAAGGDARADLLHAGPQLVGRFDLESESLRPPLDVGEPGARSGVWDVHAHANGWVYYTTYFEAMGRVDPANGRVERFDALGSGLNEIAPGPGDSLLVSRYGPSDARRGSVLQISAAGERLAEWPLEPPPGYTSAPKTVAFDPVHAEIWATTDRNGSAFAGRPTPRRSRSASVSTSVTSGSPSTRRTVRTPTPTSLATSRCSCPACRRTCIACRVSMSIIPSLAARCSECVSRRGQLRAARISGKGAVRIYGTRSIEPARRRRSLALIGTSVECGSSRIGATNFHHLTGHYQ